MRTDTLRRGIDAVPERNIVRSPRSELSLDCRFSFTNFNLIHRSFILSQLGRILI